MMWRIVIVGSGNVAQALAEAFAERAMAVEQVFSRNAERGAEVARICGAQSEQQPARLAAADVYIIAVSDRAVEQVASELPFAHDALVLHTAGAMPLDVLPCHAAARGVLYPLQTFSAGTRVDFRRIPLFVEGATESVTRRIEVFAALLSDDVRRATSAQRRAVHLAGVFACNFPNYMYICARRVIERAGLPFEVLAPLIEQTADKAVASGDPERVQTGPALRGDMVSIERHRELLQQLGAENLTEIYDLISQDIWKTLRKK